MTRTNLESLKNETFDLIVVGGGIQGACLALEGAKNGLKIALVEKGDFGAATSANSLKILHGGLRYLQHLDFRRMRESIASRRYFAKFAPELIHPLPCVIPTEMWSLKNPLPMKIALMLNDLISCKRNKGLEQRVKLPNGSLLSSTACKQLFPGIEEPFPMGGAKWFDYLILNSERLTLELLKAAEAAGAVVENYVAARELLENEGRISGISASDELSSEGTEMFEIKSKAVISCVGPWWNEQPGFQDPSVANYAPLKFAKAINLVIDNKLLGDHAIGLEAPDPNNAGEKRFFFLVPWQNGTMIGTTYRPMDEVDPDGIEVSDTEVEDILQAIRTWFPQEDIGKENVVLSHAGLLPIDLRSKKGDEGYRLHGDTTITHHKDLHVDGKRVEGLYSVKTVKYTTSPVVAQEFFKVYSSELGIKVDGSGAFEPAILPQKVVMEQLGLSEGAYAEKLDRLFAITKGDIVYYCRMEKAIKLLDVMHRRGAIDTASKPTMQLINLVAGVMAEELDWSASELKNEVSDTVAFYKSRGVRLKKS